MGLANHGILGGATELLCDSRGGTPLSPKGLEAFFAVRRPAAHWARAKRRSTLAAGQIDLCQLLRTQKAHLATSLARRLRR